MSIQTFTTSTGNGKGIPDRYNERQARNFFATDYTLDDLSATVANIIADYECELKKLNSSADYEDAIDFKRGTSPKMGEQENFNRL